MDALVTSQWLKSQIGNEDIVILDASTSTNMAGMNSDFEGLVIPKARHVDFKNSFSDLESQLPNTIPSADQFEKSCRSLGINNNSRIVVYDNLGIYSSPRLWWLFRVMGHDTVSVLDGGLPDWINSNNDVEKSYSSDYKLGNFEAHFHSGLVKSYQDIKQNIVDNNCLLIDARSRGRFEGLDPEPRKILKSGSVVNSKNLPYAEVLSSGKYKSISELKRVFSDLEIEDRDLIFSCGSGMTACIILLASHLVNENKNSLYDGSWTEWAIKEGLVINN